MFLYTGNSINVGASNQFIWIGSHSILYDTLYENIEHFHLVFLKNRKQMLIQVQHLPPLHQLTFLYFFEYQNFPLHLFFPKGKVMCNIRPPGGGYMHVNHRFKIVCQNKKRLHFSFSIVGSAAYGFLRSPIIQNVLPVVWPYPRFYEVQGLKINR